MQHQWKGGGIIMKIFYKKDTITWKNLHLYIDKKLGTAYEIKLPDYWGENSIDEYEHIIRLWDEEEFGKDYHEYCSMGEGFREDCLYDQRDYLYKIDEVVGLEETIVLALSYDRFSKELLEYFLKLKKQKNLRLHILMDLTIALREDGERFLLKYVEHLAQIDSIAFFNHAQIRDVGQDESLRGAEWIDILQTCVEIFCEEAGRILTLTKELPAVVEKELYLYHSPKGSYQKISLTEEELQDKKIKPSIVFEYISPNQGKKTCEQLKEYRREFKEKYNLKKREQPCHYTSDCKGTCTNCEKYALDLWKSVYGYGNKDIYGEMAKLNGVVRLRENIDGPGIRTLIMMDECRLNCKYCINKAYINQFPLQNRMSVYELCKIIEKDAIYYEMTGGGVTFGGGEPLLNPIFIKGFKEMYPQISIAVETSLNVPLENVSSLVYVVDYWIVDIKDMNSEIYRAYTEEDNATVIANLQYLQYYVSDERLRCRVPYIEGYNTEEDIKCSVEQLEVMGIKNIECFTYEIK